jgi:uncharacterized membrane protein
VNEQINMFWDGLFHAFTWGCVAIGIALLWRAVKRRDTVLSGATFSGALFVGWGLFNLIEGTVDHEVLQLHHVYQNGSHLLWDLVFLASGLIEVAFGAMIIRRNEHPRPVNRTPI